MNFSFEIFLLQLIIILLSINIGFLLNNKKKSFLNLAINKKDDENKVDKPITLPTDPEYQELKSSKKKYDVLEIRVLKKLIETPNSELSTEDFNVLANLTKLSKQSQRQRRHLFIKEINLKLFLHLGERESIIRKSNELDLRVKSYTLNPNIDSSKIKKLIIGY